MQQHGFLRRSGELVPPEFDHSDRDIGEHTPVDALRHAAADHAV